MKDGPSSAAVDGFVDYLNGAVAVGTSEEEQRVQPVCFRVSEEEEGRREKRTLASLDFESRSRGKYLCDEVRTRPSGERRR